MELEPLKHMLKKEINKIILTGFMGSGKTSTALFLANKLAFECIDLDAFITTRENKSIVSIFADYGEDHFRNIERKYLEELLSNNKQQIIALGGGTFCFDENIQLIKSTPNCQSVFLDLPFNEIVKRLQHPTEQNKRPKFKNTEQLYSLFLERRPFYLQADYNIQLKGNESIADIAKQVDF